MQLLSLAKQYARQHATDCKPVFELRIEPIKQTEHATDLTQLFVSIQAEDVIKQRSASSWIGRETMSTINNWSM